LRAQAALIQLRSDRENAIDHRQSAWARLAALIDRTPAGPVAPTTPPGVLGSLPAVSAIQARALRQRPEIAGARAQIAVAEAHAHLVSEQRQIALHHQLIPLARQAVESAQAGYAAGRADFVMVLDTARELRMHDLDLATHLAMYEQRLAELERAVNADLGLDESAEIGHDERH